MLERRKWRRMAFAGLAIVLVTALVGVLFGLSTESEAADEPRASTTTTTVEGTTTTTTVCQDTWPVAELNNDGHRIVAEGIAAIQNATTPEEAREAAHVHLDLVKGDPEALAATAKQYLQQDVDPSTLHKEGCMTPAADELVLEIAIAIGQATITPEDAPTNGTNSGADADGTIVSAETAGISGNRKAIKIVLKDGTTFWIMARCGNFVTNGPAFPPGPTDNPPPPPSGPPTTACPPPRGVPPEKWDYVNCRKRDQSFDEQQNQSQARQDPQNNDTSGVDVGPEPGVDRGSPPPPATRQPGHPDGGSGDGGAGPPSGPVDDTHEDDETTVSTPVPCPFGEGNC